ncbi:MAG: LacI family DNA-binding transcriptional regulator [Verrucomicrobiota bacterium]
MKVTMQWIADQVGVSKNAVSLALRNDPSISEAMRKKIRAMAEKHGYRRNPVFGELMSQMRIKSKSASQANLGLINGNQSAAAFKKHATVPSYVQGCRRRAKALGYSLDTFWLFEPGVSGSRWLEILEARGIRGIVLVGMMKENRLPAQFLEVVERIPCVVTGVRTRQPALSFACVDHFILALRAFEKSLELGYRRPALVLDRVIDELVDTRFSAGFYAGQELLPKARRLRPFFQVQQAKHDPSLFHEWLEREKPDVIFTLYNVVHDWLRALKLGIPSEIGLIQLEWRSNCPEWAGMNQHNDIVGEFAIDMLIGMIHRGESGVPEFPRGTLIGPSWREGKTVIDRTVKSGQRI